MKYFDMQSDVIFVSLFIILFYDFETEILQIHLFKLYTSKTSAKFIFPIFIFK